jgi:DNA-binding SARP family transcriptional activator
LLHGWGMERLPAPNACTVEELGLRHEPGSATGATVPVVPPASAQGSMLEVRVLCRHPDVRVDGEPVELAPRLSLLLLTLVVSPGALHVEAAHDALWPDAPFERDRLNTLVHRLRSRLGPGAIGIRRTRDTIELDPDHCRTDLADHRAALAGPAPVRLTALASVRGNLWDAAHPYEEHLVEARRQFGAQWLAAARRLAADGHDDADLTILDPAREALGFDPVLLGGGA